MNSGEGKVVCVYFTPHWYVCRWVRADKQQLLPGMNKQNKRFRFNPRRTQSPNFKIAKN